MNWFTRLILKLRYQEILRKIKLLVVDVDGTLTDGGMFYSAEGEYMKKFHTHDGKGLELLREHGITIAVITGENSQIVKKRLEKLNIELYYPGIKNKKEVLENLCKEKGFCFKETAYIGDDVNDFECMQMSGFSACPSNAVPEIKKASMYICSLSGGNGAVRELCNLIMKFKNS